MATLAAFDLINPGRVDMELIASPVDGFNYAALAPDAASKLRSTADRIRARNVSMVESIIETGRDLISVQKNLGHGQFGRWLQMEFSWTDRTARNYMRAAEEFGGNWKSISDLPPSTIYKLAAPSTPVEVRAAIVAEIEGGHAVAPDEIVRRIADARPVSKPRIKGRQGNPENRKKREARRERERLAQEASDRQRQREADAIASDLVERFGLDAVVTIMRAVDDWFVRLAVGRLLPEDRR